MDRATEFFRLASEFVVLPEQMKREHLRVLDNNNLGYIGKALSAIDARIKEK